MTGKAQFGWKDTAIVSLLVLLAGLTWLPRLRGPLDLRWDAGVYYTLGTSLAQGHGYRLLNEPGDILAVQYPPGLPLLIAAHEKILGTSDYVIVGQWLRWTYFLLSLIYAVAVYRLARDYLKPAWAGLAGMLCILAFQTIYMSDLLYAEIPFALTATLFLLCLRRADRPGYAIGAGLFAIASYLLRTAGIAVLATWVLESLIRRRFKQAAIRSAVAALPLLTWQGYIHSVTSNPDRNISVYAYQRADYQYSNVPYSQNVKLIDSFAPEHGHITTGGMIRRTMMNALSIPSAIGQAVSAPDSFWKWPLRRINYAAHIMLIPLPLVFVPILLMGAISLAGLIVLAWKGQWPLPLLVIGSIGLVCLTPWPDQFNRYLAPLIPMLLVSLVTTLALVMRWSRGQPAWLRWTGCALLLLTLVPTLVADGFTDRKSLTQGLTHVSYRSPNGTEKHGRLLYFITPWQSLDDAWEWTREHAAAGDVIATTVPQMAYVHTGLKCVLIPMEADPARERLMLDSVPISYVVTDDLHFPGISERYVCPAICNRPDLWRMVYESKHLTPGELNPDISRVYQRIRH